MMRWRPRLATVLFAVSLLIFMLPLGGIAILRLYESELIRRTETELNVQGALVASIYRTELLRYLTSRESRGMEVPTLSAYGVAMRAKPPRPKNPDDPWTPVEATLDIAKDRIHPRAPDAVESSLPPDPVAQRAGERLTPALLGAHMVTMSGIRVTDFRGMVVASTRGDVGKSISDHEEVSRALAGKHVSLLRERLDEGPTPPLRSISRRSRVRVFVAMPVIEADRVFGAVLLSRTPLDLSKALYLNRFYLIGGGAVIFAVMCTVTVLTTLLVTRPVKALIRQAEQVTQGEKGAASIPLRRPGTYEVDRLSRALAEMSVTLEKRADYISTFASNVSHEFKTPLTSIRGTVELLKDHLADMSENDRKGFLHILEQDTDRLGKLVQRLLELARADVLKPGGETTHVAEVFKHVAERFHGDNLTVSFNILPETRPIAVGPDVLESILFNLVDNARQHGGAGVHVQLSARQAKQAGRDCVQIDVQDDGKGISQSDAGRIFTPFFTTARQSGGTGLGLSIVRALVVAHHGIISLEASSSGTLFQMVLPVAQGEQASAMHS